MQTLTIFTDSVPTKKNKQRIGMRGGSPMIYKPKVVKDFEELVSDELMAQGAKRIEGPMEFSLTYVYSGKQEPDLDGTITTVLDALQDGGLFDNDKDIVRITECEKRPSMGDNHDKPRLIITIGNYGI